MVLFGNFFVGEKKKVWDEDFKVHVWTRTQIHLIPENWETYKQEFIECRINAWALMEQYKSFTRKELVLLELDVVKAISPNNRIEKTMLNRYIALLEKAQNTKDKPESTLLSYQWNGDPDIELPELYTAMRDTYNLIDQSTTPEQFKAVFTGQQIGGIESIKWIQSNRLLAYFLHSVFRGQSWQSIAGNGGLFTNAKGKIINANDLAVALSGIRSYGLPKGYRAIDEILREIKNLNKP